ncbi:hypothetical protein A3I18_00265 [Candidatus Campbellbacteria bacterium RIFCSPLOWO2_02_FULL_35_11]|uniref:Uncharacterized protein n=2 Tax=Candidatus Campbelliibacteriota TaxID=1752727 RepID=A0A1F5EN55_9BACT|nr:MAG: hypothetical protein A3E89_01395 [Candidatus Campbellbacteria bacterium RIFCSPHIGHO2_12_FULL_35_10]OGD70661.1 MAG: hypothetical protein A3I18_00265 [Candidatus Campbellbacteria bacterium RIFCSPLOWO2_02_FULL_35_11]
MSNNKCRIFASKLLFCPGFLWGMFLGGIILIIDREYAFIGWQMILLFHFINMWVRDLKRKGIYEECTGRKILRNIVEKK